MSSRIIPILIVLIASRLEAQILCPGPAGFDALPRVNGDNLFVDLQVQGPVGSSYFVLGRFDAPGGNFPATCNINPAGWSLFFTGQLGASGQWVMPVSLTGVFDLPEIHLGALIVPPSGGIALIPSPVAFGAKRSPPPCRQGGFSARKVPGAAGTCEIRFAGVLCAGDVIDIKLRVPNPAVPGGFVDTVVHHEVSAGGAIYRHVSFPCPPAGSEIKVEVNGASWLGPAHL